MPVCAFGASPNTAGLAQDLNWIGWTALNQAVAAPLIAVWPWLEAAYAPFLVSAANICATNPEPPEPLTVQDIFGLAVTHVFGMSLPAAALDKINAYVNYAAFQQLCQCNPNPNGCVSQTFPLDLNTNLLYTGPGLEFVWPASTHGNTTGGSREYLPWTQGCETVDVTIWHGAIGSAGQPQLVTHIFDCQGQLYGQSHIMGTPQTVTLRDGGCSFAGPGINLTWDWNVDPTQHPTWTAVIAPHAGQGPGPTPPPNPPPPVPPNVPPAPPLVCDSNTLCAIQWNILNQLNSTINVNQTNTTTILGRTPTSYVVGSSYTVSGSGVQATAQDILGVVVQFVVVPESLTPLPSDPPRYYDVGWIAFGAGDAVDGKRWLHSSGDRFIPVFPEVDRIYYNLTDGVTIDLVELIAPPPASP